MKIIKLCSNCGLSRVYCQSRCSACFSYWQRTKEERPARLYASGVPTRKQIKPVQGPGVICDCGKPATTWLPIRVGGVGSGSQSRKQRLALCDDCASLEKRLAPVHSWSGG